MNKEYTFSILVTLSDPTVKAEDLTLEDFTRKEAEEILTSFRRMKNQHGCSLSGIDIKFGDIKFVE